MTDVLSSGARPRLRDFLMTLPGLVIQCFQGRKAVWYLIGIALTVALVRSGFDWWYFLATDTAVLHAWMFPAALVGFVLPIYLPVVLWLAGVPAKAVEWRRAAYAVTQAEIIGLGLSSVCKAFTGRAHPVPHGTENLSEVFHFGILRGGMFWGWPSSHTAVAFAMAVAVYQLYPGRRWLGITAIVYAVYIGLGISMTIHWFSDFAAGAILGCVIGSVIGRAWRGEEEKIIGCAGQR